MEIEEFIFSHATFLPLFVEGARPFNRGMLFRGGSINDEIPLYTYGSYTASDSLMLFVEGDGFPCSSDLPLYCHNTGVGASIPLFVQGDGVNDGYYPLDNSLMLFIKCLFGAELPLYTHGGPQPSANAELPLHTIGDIEVTGSLNLVVPNVYGIISGNTFNLYTSGF